MKVPFFSLVTKLTEQTCELFQCTQLIWIPLLSRQNLFLMHFDFFLCHLIISHDLCSMQVNFNTFIKSFILTVCCLLDFSHKIYQFQNKNMLSLFISHKLNKFIICIWLCFVQKKFNQIFCLKSGRKRG